MASTADSHVEDSNEGPGAFGGFIGPRRLLSQVRNTAPFLFEGIPAAVGDLDTPTPAGDDVAPLCTLGRHPLGWHTILAEGHRLRAREDPSDAEWAQYFALCAAAHFSTVATFVPTDVDTKIRNHLWFRPLAEPCRAAMRNLAFDLRIWDLSRVSARIVTVPEMGPVSGHDGERLAVLAAGLLSEIRFQNPREAEGFEAAIDAELIREAAAFESLRRTRGRERDLLILSASLTHNAGDLDQGLSAPPAKNLAAREKLRFGRLAHERPERYGGSFWRAAALYRDVLAAEGHRHYPLREIRLLRSDSALLLPVGPFLDAWGAVLARYPKWSIPERASVLEGLLSATKKVRGQVGYFRALAGFGSAYPGGIEAPELTRHLGSAARRELRDGDLRKCVAIRRESFESSLAKRTRSILDRL